MKLPLYVKREVGRHIWVCDARRRVFMFLNDSPESMKVAGAVVAKFNGDWRYRWFGLQPFEYTREDWLWDRERPQT